MQCDYKRQAHSLGLPFLLVGIDVFLSLSETAFAIIPVSKTKGYNNGICTRIFGAGNAASIRAG